MTKPMRVSKKEEARASSDGYTVAVRPWGSGWMISTIKGGVRTHSEWVQQRTHLGPTIRMMMRDLNKFCGVGGKMAHASRMRPGRKASGSVGG